METMTKKRRTSTIDTTKKMEEILVDMKSRDKDIIIDYPESFYPETTENQLTLYVETHIRMDTGYSLLHFHYDEEGTHTRCGRSTDDVRERGVYFSIQNVVDHHPTDERWLYCNGCFNVHEKVSDW